MTRLHDPEAPDPPVGEFSTSELGAMLRESRVSLGRELEDIAAELRIRLVYLQAIEDGRLEDLPGITYATGRIRCIRIVQSGQGFVLAARNVRPGQHPVANYGPAARLCREASPAHRTSCQYLAIKCLNNQCFHVV